jgi:hypothetical protein
MPASRIRIIGLAAAAIWMVSASAVFLLPALWAIGTGVARDLFFIGAGMAMVLVAIGVKVFRDVVRLPGKMPPRTAGDRAMTRRFWLVVVAEIGGFVLVAVVCNAIRQREFIVPLCVAILGLHYLPIARIFQVPRCCTLGLVVCGAVILTLSVFPASAHFGRLPAWFAVPVFIYAPAAWVAAAANLREASRFVRASRSLATAA